MKAFKAILKIVTYIAGALAFIAGVNWLFSFLEERAHHKMPEGGKYYDWKHGKVFYHKRGHGTPFRPLGFQPYRLPDRSSGLWPFRKTVDQLHKLPVCASDPELY